MPRTGPAISRARFLISRTTRIAAGNHERVAGSNTYLRPPRIFSVRTGSRRFSARSAAPQHASAGIAGGAAELLLDADELVVLGETVGARQRPRLDLSAIGGDGKIG